MRVFGKMFTLEQYTALKESIAKGARSVQYPDGGSVTFHSLKDMLTLLKLMESELGISNTSSKGRAVLTQFNFKGS